MISPYGALLPVNKPAGLSSFDVIRTLRKACGKLKAGHAGTLDLPASGLLLICLGKATKLVPYFQDMVKEYSAVVRLGLQTDTDDMSGQPVREMPVPEGLDAAVLDAALSCFQGSIPQLPPACSALKIKGKRASDRLRNGETVALKLRTIHIYDIKATILDSERITLRVRCSRGTYIRSLARDIGEALGSCGTIQTLHRDAIGPFTADRALAPEDFTTETVDNACLAIPELLSALPALTVPSSGCAAVLNGRLPALLQQEPASALLRLLDPQGDLLALVENSGKWKFFTLFPEAF